MDTRTAALGFLVSEAVDKELLDSGVSHRALTLYRFLCGLAREALRAGELSTDTVATEVGPAEAAEYLGCSERAASRALKELGTAGALRRETRNREWTTYVVSPSHLVSSPTQAAFVDQASRSRILQQISAAKQKTSRTVERQRNKPASRKMGRGRTKGKEKKGPSPHWFLTELRERVKSNLDTVSLPKQSKKNLTIFSRLREDLGTELLTEYVSWITVAKNWSRVCREFNIRSDYPTPGIMAGFESSILPLVTQTEAERRSGGARPSDEVPDEFGGFL